MKKEAILFLFAILSAVIFISCDSDKTANNIGDNITEDITGITDIKDDNNSVIPTDNNSVSVLKFYDLTVGGRSATKSIIFKNTSNETQSLYFTPLEKFMLDPATTCDKQINPGDSCRFNFYIRMTSQDVVGEEFKVYFGDSSRRSLLITLLASAKDNNIAIPILYASESIISFIDIEAGVVSSIRSIIIRNVGSGATSLRFDKSRIGSFRVEPTSTCGDKLNNGESCRLDISVLTTDDEFDRGVVGNLIVNGDTLSQRLAFDFRAYKKGTHSATDTASFKAIKGVTVSKDVMFINFGSEFVITAFDNTSINIPNTKKVFEFQEALSTCKINTKLKSEGFCMLRFAVTADNSTDNFIGIFTVRSGFQDYNINLNAGLK